MGKEISYCQTCGERLGVGEAAETQVYVHDGRRYCATCRPAGATSKIALPDPRKSSTKVRAQAPAARVRETTRIRKRRGLPVALTAGAVVALGIGIAIAAANAPAQPRPAQPPVTVVTPPESRPAPKPDPGPSVNELLRRIREIRQADLMFARREEVLRLLAETVVRAGSRLEEVDLFAADYDRKFEEAAGRLADFTRSEAARMAAKQKYAEAIERLDGYPAAFRTSRSADALRQIRVEYARRRDEAGIPPATPGSAPRRLIADSPWHAPAPAQPRRIL